MVRILTRSIVSSLMTGCAAFAAIVALGQMVQGAIIVTGEQEALVPSPNTATQTSVEIFLDLTEADDGGALSVGNFQVRVVLSGPSAGTDVSIVGIEETVTAEHPQAADLNFANTVISPVEGVNGTLNFGAPFDINDEDGLVRVVLEVQPNVTGNYNLAIVTGVGNTELTDPDDFTTRLPFETIDGSLTILTVIPEPSSFALLGFAMIGLGGIARARHRRFLANR